MKRRIFKQFLSGILGIILLLSLAGCGQSTSNSKPDDTMEAFYDLIIKQDTTSMTDLGIDDSEASDTLKTYQTSMISTLQKSFKNAGVTITKKQANEIYKAISSKLSSLDHKITVTGQDKKMQQLRCLANTSIIWTFLNKQNRLLLDELKPLHIENLSDAKKQLVSNVIEAFNSTDVSSDMHTQTFKLKLQKIKSGKNTLHIFFPDNYEEVGSKLMKNATNQ